MKLIVIEGLDGSGKTTQIEKIKKYLSTKNIKTKYIHFPDYNSPVYGELISRFLRGELGSINEVNPYLVALLYAGDRNNAKEKINNWLQQDYVVLADRYVYSNIAYQGTKLHTDKEKEDFIQWVLDTEYNKFQIPKPDLNLYLDVPFSFIKQNLKQRRENENREYLKGKKDIHEDDFSFQENVYKMYKYTIKHFSDFIAIKCYDSEKNILPVEKISNQIIEKIQQILP